jgi:hypothetical protein
MTTENEFQWDAFISHASEDKEEFVVALVDELQKFGLKIWFDQFSLKVGDSLRESIDHGLAQSSFGIVVLSPSFFSKQWPQQELNGLFSREMQGRKVILPVRHDLRHEDLVQRSLLLADKITIGSDKGIGAVARSLIEVIRPEAFSLETSRADALKAAARLREQLREKDARLDYRITYGVEDVNPLQEIGKVAEPGTIISGITEGMKIEAFAVDRDKYNAMPLAFKAQMPPDALAKFQELHRTGRPVEFGPEDGIKISSDAFPFGLSTGMFTAIQRFVATPSAEIMRRKLHFRLTFAHGEEREEFPFIEFEIVRPGLEEIEIRSCAPALPFQLTLILNLVARDGAAAMHFSFAGHEIRKIYKANRALQLFLGGGTLEVWDLQSDQRVAFLGGGKKTSSDSEADISIDRFINGLYEVATAFKETITWNPASSGDDAIHLHCLLELVHTGMVSIECYEITLTLTPSPGVDIEAALRRQSVIRFEGMTVPPEFATVFGKPLPVGPYSVLIEPLEIESRICPNNPADRVVRIVPAKPLLYEFENFKAPRKESGDRVAKGTGPTS